jgi:hypothetical protein
VINEQTIPRKLFGSLLLRTFNQNASPVRRARDGGNQNTACARTLRCIPWSLIQRFQLRPSGHRLSSRRCSWRRFVVAVLLYVLLYMYYERALHPQKRIHGIRSNTATAQWLLWVSYGLTKVKLGALLGAGSIVDFGLGSFRPTGDPRAERLQAISVRLHRASQWHLVFTEAEREGRGTNPAKETGRP